MTSPLPSLLVAAALLSACAAAGQSDRSECFMVDVEDLAVQKADDVEGITMVCGLQRVVPSAHDKYRERYGLP